ncbi:MAG: cobalamin-binding protein [Drouetiella hepatica Uher 2000/2452]|uniref:Cobalamin-binding protein n=1 Tax=Drouetiella hepatica Uher 2000/2452 TaxID=904376 RepID=A0A951QC02_9CYAN|nr:cobalamin-binding protein [Drouetiella hepatica Uher 2000/2452]
MPPLPPPRIVSLIPSATEIVAALGLADCLVGRSHECDYPPSVVSLPICTEPKFDPEGTSAEIHDRVTDLLQSALSVYRVKTEVLEQLQPTHILTQAQCEVCAVSLGEVEQAVDCLTHSQPQIISLQPNVLADLWTDIEQVAAALGVESQPVIDFLQQRVETCAQGSSLIADRPRVACIEWIEPLMAAGNWIPELVELAGGRSLFGEVGQHSPWLQWEALTIANPDLIILMPCGFDLTRTTQEARSLPTHPEWANLSAVKTGQVYVTDGNQYFNRPGTRLVDSLEILAEILHPDRFNFGYEGSGWRRVREFKDPA